MAHEILAPWAEVVPGAKIPMTASELLSLPNDGWTYELVEGRLVRMPPSGGGASNLGMNLGTVINNHVLAHDLGGVTGADGEFVLSQPGEPDTSFAPDIAFVRRERLPNRDLPEWELPWRLAPDLAVEIASPNQYKPEMAEKARRYLDAGVRLVWVVWPRYRQVDVWRPGAGEPFATLTSGDTLDGYDVLPGFAYPLAQLFR